MKCQNCGSIIFKVEGQFMSEYHDAEISFHGIVEGDKFNCEKREIFGSYYLERCKFVCVACEEAVLDIEDLNVDEEEYDEIYSQLVDTVLG